MPEQIKLAKEVRIVVIFFSWPFSATEAVRSWPLNSTVSCYTLHFSHLSAIYFQESRAKRKPKGHLKIRQFILSCAVHCTVDSLWCPDAALPRVLLLYKTKPLLPPTVHMLLDLTLKLTMNWKVENHIFSMYIVSCFPSLVKITRFQLTICTDDISSTMNQREAAR